MDQDWTRKEARKAADKKVEEAIELLREAKSIYHANDYDVSSLNCREAIEYASEVVE